MYGSIKGIQGYALRARDGDVGRIRDVCFDDSAWVLRHLVAHIATAPDGRVVRIPQQAVQQIDHEGRVIDVALSRQQIHDASERQPLAQPPAAAGYVGLVVWGPDMHPIPGEPLILATGDAAFPATLAPLPADPPLRSGMEVIGYHVAATDGASGHIADLLFDDLTAQIRFVVVDTHNWLPDRLVLVAPAWISHIDQPERQVRVRATRDAVKSSPRYTPDRSVSAADEDLVQSHYTAWLAAAARARDRFVATE